jgi:hypothetical protein
LGDIKLEDIGLCKTLLKSRDIQHDEIELYNTPPDLSDIKPKDIGLYKTLLKSRNIQHDEIELYNTPPNLGDIKPRTLGCTKHSCYNLNWRILSDTIYPLI